MQEYQAWAFHVSAQPKIVQRVVENKMAIPLNNLSNLLLNIFTKQSMLCWYLLTSEGLSRAPRRSAGVARHRT